MHTYSMIKLDFLSLIFLNQYLKFKIPNQTFCVVSNPQLCFLFTSVQKVKLYTWIKRVNATKYHLLRCMWMKCKIIKKWTNKQMKNCYTNWFAVAFVCYRKVWNKRNIDNNSHLPNAFLCFFFIYFCLRLPGQNI